MDRPEKRNAPGMATPSVSDEQITAVNQCQQSSLNLPSGEARSLADSACCCGPGRKPTARYTCMTCGAFARIGLRIDERTPNVYVEWRTA